MAFRKALGTWPHIFMRRKEANMQNGDVFSKNAGLLLGLLTFLLLSEAYGVLFLISTLYSVPLSLSLSLMAFITGRLMLSVLSD
jgi:hypothetical protein